MKVIQKPLEIFSQIDFLRREGSSIGLVPTMGALHQGHLSLVKASVEECDITVATIFVNPSQFGPNEDFQRYPRTVETDLAGLEAEGADFVFLPDTTSIYSPSHSTWIEPPAIAARLEGEFRPGHYRGVATIVLKLFHLIPAHVAFFGQKDFQQCLVVEKMIEDLNVPIRVRRCPTLREADGLAMSSRNRYLNPDDRKRALGLSRALKLSAKMLEEGCVHAPSIEHAMQEELMASGVDRIDYARVVDAATLDSLSAIEGPCVALIAAHVGTTRLIDNQMLFPSASPSPSESPRSADSD